MKSNSIDIKSKKNMINTVKINLINNIPKTKPNKESKNNKSKIIKSKTSNNPSANYKTQYINNMASKRESTNFIKNISNYITINKSLLLSSYEKSILILFDNLKSYMKNDLIYFNKLKENFIKNVQNFYQKNKSNFSIIPYNKNIPKKEEIKIDNYVNYKSNLKNKNIKSKSNCNITFHQKNKSHINKSISKIFSGLSNNSINKSNFSIQGSSNYKKSNKNYDSLKNDIKNKAITHKKSLYSLIRGNKQLISNSPVKDLGKKNYQFSILNNFINFNKKIKNNFAATAQNGFTIKPQKSHKERNNTKEKDKEEKNIYKNCSFNIHSLNKKDVNNYIANINNNINNNIYYNNIISQMPNNSNSDKYIINNDLITCIKNSLDENLKGMFDFSYESFLNKETEREGN